MGSISVTGGGGGGVGVRVYTTGKEFVLQTFDQIGAGGRKMWAEIALGEKTANPALRSLSRAANEGKQFVQSLAAETGSLGRVLGGLGPLGIGAAAALGGLVLAAQKAREAMKWGDALDEQAKAIGVSVEKLQELTFVADEFDVPAGAMADALKNLNGALGAMRTGVGDGKLKAAFKELGIAPEALAAMNDASDLLPLLADQIKALGTTADQVQLARKLGVEAILPALRQGAAGLEEMAVKARDLGVVLSNETVAALADANREMEKADLRIQTSLRLAVAGLADDMVNVATSIADATKELVKFIGWWKQMEITGGGDPFTGMGAALRQKLGGGRGLGIMVDTRPGQPLFSRAPDELSADIDWSKFVSPDQGNIEARNHRADARNAARLRFSPSGSGGGGRVGPKVDTWMPQGIETTPWQGRVSDGAFSSDGMFHAMDALAASIKSVSDQALESTKDIKISGGILADYFQEVRDNSHSMGEDLQFAAAEGFQDLSRGLADAVVNAENLGDVAKGVFRKMVADFLAARIEAGIAKTASFVGKLFGIPSFASGIEDFGGGLAYVHAGEVLTNLPPHTNVRSASDSRRMMGGVDLGGIHITLNAPGSGPREIDQLRAMVADLKQSLPGLILGTVNDGLDRGMIAG